MNKSICSDIGLIVPNDLPSPSPSVCGTPMIYQAKFFHLAEPLWENSSNLLGFLSRISKDESLFYFLGKFFQFAQCQNLWTRVLAQMQRHFGVKYNTFPEAGAIATVYVLLMLCYMFFSTACFDGIKHIFFSNGIRFFLVHWQINV